MSDLLRRLFARRLLVPCLVETEQTEESLYLYAVPENVRLRPGDTVRVIDPPEPAAFGERHTYRRMAEVRRADPFTRLLTQIGGAFALTDLYEVGFEPREHP